MTNLSAEIKLFHLLFCTFTLCVPYPSPLLWLVLTIPAECWENGLYTQPSLKPYPGWQPIPPLQLFQGGYILIPRDADNAWWHRGIKATSNHKAEYLYNAIHTPLNFFDQANDRIYLRPHSCQIIPSHFSPPTPPHVFVKKHCFDKSRSLNLCFRQSEILENQT